MLVLTRRPGERIMIGDGIVLQVVEIKGNRVRLGFEAPSGVSILRSELRPLTAESEEPAAVPLEHARPS